MAYSRLWYIFYGRLRGGLTFHFKTPQKPFYDANVHMFKGRNAVMTNYICAVAI
jgi:hypothetical protein